MSIKRQILLAIGAFTLTSLLGYLLLIRNAAGLGQALGEQAEGRVQELIAGRASRIDEILSAMERQAVDLALAGEGFYRLRQQTGLDVTDGIRTHLMRFFTETPGAIGGGLWYEPERLFAGRRHFGPYVFRDQGRVTFTWDLSTPEYDYHTQAWYLAALPPDWDRRRERPRRTWWTEPYFDDAGTHALMITVDALMFEPDTGILGMATVDLSLERMQALVADLLVTPGTRAFAVDGLADRLVAYPGQSDRLMQAAHTLPWHSEMQAARRLPPGRLHTTGVTLAGQPATFCGTYTQTGMGIGLVVPNGELYAVRDGLQRAGVITSALVVGIQAVLAGLVALILLRRISTPLAHLTGLAHRLAEGDLGGAADRLRDARRTAGGRQDETGQLLTAFSGMVAGLSGLARDVRQAGRQVAEAVARIGSTSRQLEANVVEQAASTRQVNATGLQISNTAAGMCQTLADVAATVDDAAAAATGGRDGLSGLGAAMGNLTAAGAAVAQRLTVIRERADRVNQVVGLIDRMADHTHLLSVNASIEAEQAGDAGRGFAVVAREVGHLADQTTAAAADITLLVKQMRDAVADGVAEMDTLTREVSAHGQQVTELSDELGQVIEQVHALAPHFQAASRSAETQAAGAGQIAAAMRELTESADSTRAAVRDLNSAAEGLDHVVAGLSHGVDRFRV